ncbi:MAG: sugar phosphate isomerase/epimerase family protein [Victivallaceae bacterium]|nr:sugar phosphate isomerase/epimerase family protein [Victivallaceae bacterium]
MFKLELRASAGGLARPLDRKAVTAMRLSRIAGFELTPANFEGDGKGVLRAELKNMFEEAGKLAPTYHVPFDRLDDVSDTDEAVRLCALERLRRYLDEAYFFGAGIVVLHPSTEPADGARAVHIRQLARSLADITPALTARGQFVALEWLPRSCIGNSFEELDAVMKLAQSQRVGICLDLNHLMSGHRELPEMIVAFGDRLLEVHVSDYDGVDEKHWMPGEGVIDWPAVIGALRRIGFDGAFNYELYPVAGSAEDNVRRIEKNFFEFMNKL